MFKCLVSQSTAYNIHQLVNETGENFPERAGEIIAEKPVDPMMNMSIFLSRFTYQVIPSR